MMPQWVPTIDLCSKACCFARHVRRGLLEGAGTVNHFRSNEAV
jgi:hypothetical protein